MCISLSKVHISTQIIHISIFLKGTAPETAFVAFSSDRVPNVKEIVVSFFDYLRCSRHFGVTVRLNTYFQMFTIHLIGVILYKTA